MNIENTSIPEQRQQLRQWLQNTIAGQQVQHSALPKPISLNWQGLKHCLSSTAVEPLRQFHALYQLPQLLLNAIYSHYEPDSHTPPRTGVGVYIFYATCELDNQSYKVWLRVRATPDGLYFYALGVVR